MAEPEVEELTDRDKVSPSKGQDEAPVGEIAPPPTGGRKPMEGRIIRGTKREWTARLLVCFSWNITPSPRYVAPEIPVFERKNSLIHLHYIRKDFETCKVRKFAQFSN